MYQIYVQVPQSLHCTLKDKHVKVGSRLFLFLGAFVAVTPVVMAQGKISGVFYGDYFYNVARDTSTVRENLPNSALTGPASLQGFVIRRVFFTYDQDLAEQFAMRFRLEFDQTANSSGAYAILPNGNASVYVKDAWLRWKSIFAGSDLYFGVQPTSAYDISEGLWSYRSLEKTIMDLRGIVSSRHLGIALRGVLDQENIFSYWVTVANVNSGSQPKDVTPDLKNGDKYNLYSFHLAYRPIQELALTLYGDFRPSYPVDDPSSTTVPKATVSNNTFTGALSAGYKRGNDFAVGVEAFTQQTDHAYTDPTAPTALKTLSKIGLSFWGWYNFNDFVGAVARFDYYNPKSGSNNSEKGDSRSYILAGLTYRPVKSVQIMPNIQIETYESIPNGRSIGAAVTGRLTIAFSF
jgi:hypothetical protein